MGYSTDFTGSFQLDRPLDIKLFTFLNKFNDVRHMKRKAGKEFGVEGEFYVDGGTDGNTGENGVIDHNTPPSTQPGLWCQWCPTKDGTEIKWDGGEKFYAYIPWLEYIIKNFLKPNKYKLNGEVTWQGEESSDFGKIIVKNNKVTIKTGVKVYK
jgi:hypothetical protein